MASFSVVRGSFDGAGPAIPDVLRAAANLQAGGVTFYSLLELSPTLDPGELRAHRALATDLDLSIDASLDWLNPARPERVAAMAAVGSGDLSAGFERMIAAASAIGIRQMYFSVGTLEDRDQGWDEQLEALTAFLRASIPVLRCHGVRLLLKTHEEITSFETLNLLERVDSEWLGVSLDPVNLLVRLEDPVAATRRLAPYIAQVHIDDAVLRFEGNGVRRYLCPVGDGVVDWPAVLALVPEAARLVELHRGQFAMPVFDPHWLARQDYLDVPGLAAFFSLATSRLAAQVPDQSAVAPRLAPALALARQAAI